MSAAELWDPAAPGWERHFDAIDAHTAAATARMLARARLEAGSDVLDLAAGPGGAGLAAAEVVGPTGTVLLSDAAPAMAQAATRRAAGHPNVRSAVFDLTAIDAADDAFDAVVCRHGLMFVPDPAAAVREVVRVLRPGGRFATVTWAARAENPWLGLAFDAVGAQFGVAFPPAGVPGPFALDDPGRLAAALVEGGLQQVTVEHVEAPLREASLEAWFQRTLETAGPLALAYASMDESTRTAIRDRALAAARGHARTAVDGVVLDGETLVAAGQAPG